MNGSHAGVTALLKAQKFRVEFGNFSFYLAIAEYIPQF